MTPRERAAMTTYEFRPPRAGETEAAWREKLIAHVHTRDFTAAHELRTGKPAAEWTPAERKAFILIADETPLLSDEFQTEAAYRIEVNTLLDPTVNDAVLQAEADRVMTWLSDLRTTKPTVQIVPLLNVLLTTGQLLTTGIVNSDDRLALIMRLVATQPVFGYVLGHDAFIHSAGHDFARGAKCDGLIVEVGSRTLRRTQTRPYWVRLDHRVQFGPVIDVDRRRVGLQDMPDPYAGIFAGYAQGSPS